MWQSEGKDLTKTASKMEPMTNTLALSAPPAGEGEGDEQSATKWFLTVGAGDAPGVMPVCTAPPVLRPWKGRWGASTHSAPTLKGPFTQPPSTGTSLPLSSTSTLLSSHASGYLTRAFCVQNTVRAPGPANSASGVKIFLSGIVLCTIYV